MAHRTAAIAIAMAAAVGVGACGAGTTQKVTTKTTGQRSSNPAPTTLTPSRVATRPAVVKLPTPAHLTVDHGPRVPLGPSLIESIAAPNARLKPTAVTSAGARSLRMFKGIVLPPGAVSLTTSQMRGVDGPPEMSACSYLYDYAGGWAVPQSPSQLATFLRSKIPDGSTFDPGSIGHMRDGHLQATLWFASVQTQQRTGTDAPELYYSYATRQGRTILRAEVLSVVPGSACTSTGASVAPSSGGVKHPGS